MRGKVSCSVCILRAGRITPAHAGKSESVVGIVAVHDDHPRTCGEKVERMDLYFKKLGSPPHMRGKVVSACGVGKGLGITPAHAGKRQSPWFYMFLLEDHPRTCGEKYGFSRKFRCWEGSPPHMRGKENQKQHRTEYNRITPAHAGKRTGSKV